MFIELATNQIRFSQDLLGTDEAWLWVGSAYSPLDNDDARVRETRELMEKYYPYVPYGMQVGNKTSDGMKPMRASEGYYTLDVSWWPVGSYRLNLHTAPGVESPFGSKLHPEHRDQDCSWATLENFKDELLPFFHTEENGAGLSIRILIRPDRSIEAFGDMRK
jgi:hypothetical protein